MLSESRGEEDRGEREQGTNLGQNRSKGTSWRNSMTCSESTSRCVLVGV